VNLAGRAVYSARLPPGSRVGQGLAALQRKLVVDAVAASASPPAATGRRHGGAPGHRGDLDLLGAGSPDFDLRHCKTVTLKWVCSVALLSPSNRGCRVAMCERCR